MNPRLPPQIMLSEAQSRLLRALAEFPASLDNAWDVPRGLSLPGLSERLGVVRSALNPPISSLESDGLVITRKAHVIGGGHRKRTVVHLTEEGRVMASGLAPESPSEEMGVLRGDAPPLVHLFGREEMLRDICREVATGSSLQLVGLPGIGKSSLLRQVAEEFVGRGWDVTWVSIDAFTDLDSLSRDILQSAEGMRDVEAAVAAVAESGLAGEKTLLFVDELQAVHSRHSDLVCEFLTSLASSDAVTLCIGCKAPSPLKVGEVLLIDELAVDDALNLLPDGLTEEEAMAVVEALGGHPLALKLWQPGHSLPEADDRIQEFIKCDVVDVLSSDCLATLDELAASPLPILVDQMENDDGVAELDDAALLRWAKEATELQHLVRNVRRAMWSEEEAAAIHNAAASHWAGRIEAEAKIHSAHHLVEGLYGSDDKVVVSNLQNGLAEMMEIDSAAMAAILSNAMAKLPDAGRLKLLAARVAVERGEGEVASDLLSDCQELGDDVDYGLLNARIMRLSGDFDGAEKTERELLTQLPPSEAVRIALNRMVLALEDRLPGPLNEDTAAKIAAKIDDLNLDGLASGERRAALVTIASIKHKLALERGDAEAAARIRTDLAFLTNRADPLIEELAARAALRFGGDGGRVRNLLTRTTNPLRRCALGLQLIAHAHASGVMDLTGVVAECEHPPNLGTTTARRLSAMLWYWRGVVEPHQRIKCWREALYRFGMAECANAYIQLQHKLHDSIR